MDDLSSPCVFILKGGLEQLFNFQMQVTLYPLIQKSLPMESLGMRASHTMPSSKGDHESAQEITCAYPEPLPTF